MRKKIIITTFTFLFLSLFQMVDTFGSTLTADSNVHEFKYITNQVKKCEKCGKTIPANKSCPFCN